MTQKLSDERASEFDTPSNTNSDGFAGVFVLVAVLLLLAGWMWLKNYSPLHPPQRFSVTFHNVAGLISNAIVNVNGVKVGDVEDLKLAGKDKVVVKIKITKDTVIPVGSHFDILSNGVVGAKYVEITLPQENTDQKLAALDENSVVEGNDPVRVEVVVSKVAKQFEDFDFRDAHERVNQHMEQFARAADSVTELTKKLSPAANHAVEVENKIGDLATDMRGTTRRVNRLLDNPELSSDLKQTALHVRETAVSINKTMHELNETLANKPLRADLLEAMDRLNQSTIHIQQSVESVQKITGDQTLRTDIKQIIANVNQTMDKADRMLSRPGFGTDMRGTLGEVRGTVRHLDLAARQLNAILGQKHPLVHLIFGQPGSVKNAEKFDSQTVPAKRQKNQTDSRKTGPSEQASTDTSEPTSALPDSNAEGRDAPSGASSGAQPLQ
jgi:ABC-type transporter Mla subunit MlaD